MLKTKKYLTLFAVSLLTLPSCDTNDSLSAGFDGQGKAPIELMAGVIGENTTGTPAKTRNVVTTDNPYGHSAQSFGSGTSLYMVIKSDNGTTSPLYTRTIGYAQEVTADPANSTLVKFTTAYTRFWEDSQSPARDSKLSVYSACVPGYYLEGSVYSGITPNGTVDGTTWSVGGSTTYSNTWSTDLSSTTIAWPLRSALVGSQTTAFLQNQDICFSNNVSNHTSDERLAFNTTTNKFTSGRMVFHHALTKVTFMIKKGTGFETGDAFAFTNASENIVLKGFNTTGTFNISTGEFESIGTTSDITNWADTKYLATTEDQANYNHILTCMLLPGSALTSTATNEVYFTIDNNKYHIKKSELAAALNDKTLTNTSLNALAEGSTMRPGVHYVFTMTVSKKKIDKLTASVVPWEVVEADEITPTNARITVSLLDNRTHQNGSASFNLYRKASDAETIKDDFVDYTWTTGYVGNKATLTENSTGSGVYTAIVAASNPATPWYWPDNKTYYHFRAVMPLNHTVTTDAENGDYISLTGAIAPFTDVCWGAPFKTTIGTLTYSTTYGFDNTSGESHQIYQAIGPTSETITLQIFHMMSDVTIRLTTTTDANQVDLTGATVKLTPLYSAGRVRMGDGLILTTGSAGDVTGTVVDVDGQSYKQWKYGFVPQSLTGVVLTITTADNNQYIVHMKDMIASVSNTLVTNPYTETSSGSGKYTINYWYPNYKYTYTFKLKKTGIETLSATIADWETVSADNQEIQIQ